MESMFWRFFCRIMFPKIPFCFKKVSRKSFMAIKIGLISIFPLYINRRPTRHENINFFGGKKWKTHFCQIVEFN